MTDSSNASAEAALDRAEALLAGRALDEAAVEYDRAAQAGAAEDRCAAGRWTLAMLQGCFEQAWQQSDAIRQRGAPDPHRFWDGRPIKDRHVVVRCLHGLGDSVQMLQFLPLLQQSCRSVMVEVPPRLYPLAPYFAGMDRAITWGEEAPQTQLAWDAQIEIMELPYLFRTTLSDLPLNRKYLTVPSTLARETGARMAAVKPTVGVVWSASEWDPTRSLPRNCLERLLTVPGIAFWNLQGGTQHAAGQQIPAVAAIHNAAQFGMGLLPLTAVMANLDLVITVDTLAAHLAGAMGIPAWVLLQVQADWRWMHMRSDTPWYPSLRLWRQPVQNDWDSLITAVCHALPAWAREATPNG